MDDRYRPRRPKSKRKRCQHCKRNRLRRFIEWHPGIDAWQCSSLSDCGEAIEALERNKDNGQ